MGSWVGWVEEQNVPFIPPAHFQWVQSKGSANRVKFAAKVEVMQKPSEARGASLG